MITIWKKTYQTNNNFQDTFTRIRLDVERVDTLFNPWVGNLTADTNKPWVGKINSSEGKFKVMQTNSSVLPIRFFEGNFFTIVIDGQVSSTDHKTLIDVRYKLGLQAMFTFILLYFFPLGLAIKFINAADWESLRELTLWLIVFDLIPTL
ncbi:MAG TPA: hypothetical protein VGD31_11130, partial [Sphingobacteriaceae bacterium]